jgi:phage tail sheath protein FI
LQLPDPLNGYRLREVGPSGTMAGVYARTDGQRGVWKAPAGVAAVLEGADVALKVTDADNGTLNSAGVNVLRTFPVYGPIAWGARTLAGADLLDSEWKYINVRRLVDYIEQSLVQSLKWVVFEPNDEATWGQIRLEVGSFLSGLFADGAFSGATPAAAYFVNCDATTTTADDIDRGIVNILVGVAPVKPAEFVVLQIEQIAAQAAG